MICRRGPGRCCVFLATGVRETDYSCNRRITRSLERTEIGGGERESEGGGFVALHTSVMAVSRAPTTTGRKQQQRQQAQISAMLDGGVESQWRIGRSMSSRTARDSSRTSRQRQRRTPPPRRGSSRAPGAVASPGRGLCPLLLPCPHALARGRRKRNPERSSTPRPRTTISVRLCETITRDQ